LSWKRTLWILWMTSFLVAAGISLVVPFLPLYVEHLGIHNLSDITRWAGWVYSASFATAMIFQPIWGKLADRHGRKIMLLRAGLGMGVVTALMGAVSSVWQLLLLRLLYGVFSGFTPMAISLQASITPNEEAGKALGLLQTGAIAGTLIGPLIGGIFAELLGFRNVFYLTGGLLITASIITVIFVTERRQAVAAAPAEHPKGAFKQLLPLSSIFIASAITQIGMMSIEPIVSLFAGTIYTGSHLTFIAGLVVAMSGVANLIGAPTLGKLGDRIGQRKVLILALCAAACMYIPQALAQSVGMLLLGRFLLGLFIGGMIPSLNVLVKIHAPQELQATAFGFNSSANCLGNLVGPLIGSSVAASYGIRNVFYVTMAFLLINAIVIFFNKKLDVKPNPAAAETSVQAEQEKLCQQI